MATWVGYPRSYTPGRARPIQYVVIHSTEGSEGPTSAEAGAAYDKRRTDGTSTHLFVDSDTALREVPDSDRAHAARFHGNEIGVQVELCGRASQTAAQWRDEYSMPMLRLAAAEVAAICRQHDIPVRRLTADEVRAAYYGQVKPKGICGHVHVTAAYPEDGGSHTDPGPNFPWDEFLDMVRAATEEGDDMAVAYKTPVGYFISNGVHRRGPIGTSGPVFGPAINDTGMKVLTLTDAQRVASGSPTWEVYLDKVAGPLAPTGTVSGAVDLAAVAKAVNDDVANRMKT